jgi:pseudomonalisin
VSKISRLTPSIVTAATVAIAAGGLAPAAGAATHGWAATHTQALHLTGAALGAAPASQRLTISATLPLRNRAAIDSLIAQRTILSAAQVRARFSPTAATAASVASYLRSQGFTRLSVAQNRLLVTGSATVAQAERAFDTQISTYRLNGQLVYANTAAASVPTALSGKVTAVLGLSDVPMNPPKLAPTTAPKLTAAGTPDLTGFDPNALINAYDATKLAPATSTTTAIIAMGDMTGTIADLRYAEQQFKFPTVPVSVIYDGPAAGIVNNNPLTGSAEWDLDTQYSTMVAGAVKQLDIYDVATYTDPEVARGINMFVSQDKATNLSASLGECDYIAFLDGAMLSTDEMLAEGALQGQSAFASTGDNGYACPEGASTGVPEGPPGDSWPADGEYTTGVGGTTLLADSSGNVSDELAWIGGGGGVSPWETAAPWTLQANPAGQTWIYTNQGGRSVPDVAAVADSTTPVLVYTSHTPGSTPSGVGGTSVASPVTEGLYSRIQAAHHNRAGLAQYNFYALYNKVNPATATSGPVGDVYTPNSSPQPVKGFRDITVGTNGGCAALPGYDYCTGIGSLQAFDLSGQL